MNKKNSRRLFQFIRGVIIFGVGLAASCVAILGLGVSSAHAETHITDGFLYQDTIWNASGSPYLIGADVSVPYGRSLIIGPGTVVTGDPDLGWEPNIYANGPVIMNGEPTNQVSISGLYGLTIDHSTTTIKYARITTSSGLSFINSFGSISSSTITGSSQGIHSITSNVNVIGSYIKGNDYGVVVEPVAPIFQVRLDEFDDTGGIGNALEDIPMVIISSSSLINNKYAAIKNTTTIPVQAINNWWGSKDGPATSTIIGSVNYIPWLNHDPLEESTSTPCCSSVLFLPGVEGTWLYCDEPSPYGHGTSTNTLWAPNSNNDVRALFLDINGSSTDKTIYSGAPVDNVFNLYHVYSSFEKFMDGLVHIGSINEWKSFGYDWRKPITEVVAGVEKKATTTESLINTVRDLATRSRTGKATLVAHSNGGLVAEDLVKVLNERGSANLIDSVISVAVPYIGTPTAISSILHGDHQSIAGGLILKASVARELGQNMSSAYSLLPSSAYYSKVTTPSIIFASTTVSGINNGSYAQVIHTLTDQNSFIDDSLGVRKNSAANALANGDTSFPIIGNSILTKAAESIHSVLDAFSWPTTINRWNLLGWNNETPRALKYSSERKCSSFFGLNETCSSVLVHSESVTQMGDGTVVAPSAAYSSGATKVISLDLGRESQDAGESISHANILESSSTQAVIKSIITQGFSNANNGLESFVKSVSPAVSFGEPDYSKEPVRLVMTLEGDADIGITDQQGRHTGIIPLPASVSANVTDDVVSAYEEKIPDSHFVQLSDNDAQTSRISLPDTGQKYTVKVNGSGLGSFALAVDRVRGDQNIGHAEYSNIPMSPLSVATTTIIVPPTDIGNIPVSLASSTNPLQIDFDGDGTVDFVASSTTATSTTATSTTATSSQIIHRLELLKNILQKLNKLNIRAKNLMTLIDKLTDLAKKNKLHYKYVYIKNRIERVEQRGHLILSKLKQSDQNQIVDQIGSVLENFDQ